jgi:hypothetical protein
MSLWFFLLLLSAACAGVRAARAAGIPVFGITSGQEPAVLWEAGCCMLMQDFQPLVALAEQHCSTAAAAGSNGNGSGAGAGVQQASGQQQRQQQSMGEQLIGGKAATAPVGIQIVADSRQQ